MVSNEILLANSFRKSHSLSLFYLHIFANRYCPDIEIKLNNSSVPEFTFPRQLELARACRNRELPMMHKSNSIILSRLKFHDSFHLTVPGIVRCLFQVSFRSLYFLSSGRCMYLPQRKWIGCLFRHKLNSFLISDFFFFLLLRATNN